MNTVTIEGRTWFEKANGNTYHAARIVVNGETVAVSPVTYGYGRQYEETARMLVRDLLDNDDPKFWVWRELSELFDERPSFGGQHFYKVNAIKWRAFSHVERVTRKRDLVPEFWLEALRDGAWAKLNRDLFVMPV